MRNRYNINSFSKNYNERLLKRLNYNRLIICYKKIANRLIYYNINKKIKNLFDYFAIKTILNLRTQKKLRRCFKQN
jgi:hypothetical protein